jgi:hypothetical protein
MTIQLPTQAPYLVGYRERDTPIWYWWRGTNEAGWTSWKLVNGEWEQQSALTHAWREAILFHFGLEWFTDVFPHKTVVLLSPRKLLLCRRAFEVQCGLRGLNPRSRPGLSHGIKAEFVL